MCGLPLFHLQQTRRHTRGHAAGLHVLAVVARQTGTHVTAVSDVRRRADARMLCVSARTQNQERASAVTRCAQEMHSSLNQSYMYLQTLPYSPSLSSASPILMENIGFVSCAACTTRFAALVAATLGAPRAAESIFGAHSTRMCLHEKRVPASSSSSWSVGRYPSEQSQRRRTMKLVVVVVVFAPSPWQNKYKHKAHQHCREIRPQMPRSSDIAASRRTPPEPRAS